VKVAAAAITIYEVGSWVYDSFFAGDEATDQDVTSSGDRLASAEGPVATTMTSFVNTAEDAVLWSEYGPTREAVNEIIINGNRALTSNPFDANDKFIENLKLQMHLADLYLDDPVSARQVGLQIMSVGAALYNGTPYAVTNNKVVIPQNDMVGLISSMLLNMSDCSGVLTAASIEEVSATDPSGYATLITDKQSADGMQQYLKHNA